MPADLAAKLDAAREARAMEGERRVVTMLFCDLKGSTAAAEQLDPEEWTQIMNGAFEYMIRPVYKYEGTVARLMGDAILAFFGAPIAHEDDPQRAVLAGLQIVADIQPYRRRIQDEWGVDFDARVGINTGLVVVGTVGSDLRMEYTAQGDAINLAARMEQTAAPGTVQLTGETYRHVAPLFDFEPLGTIEVKGKAEPVRVYRPLRPQRDPGRLRGIEGLEAPLVGREPELGLIRRVLSDLQAGRGQIVCVIGEAGLGKSRLIAETQSIWKEMLGMPPDSTGPPPRWTQSAGVSYDTEKPYSQWQQHIRQVCGLVEADSHEVLQEKLETALQRWPPDQRGRARRVFLRILGVSDDEQGEAFEGETLKRELFAAMLEGFRATTGDAPPILAFDDLHWADPASVELLIHLFQLTNETPILFLCNFRPERGSAAWEVREAAAGSYAHLLTEIKLRPLNQREEDELVSGLLAADLPQDLRRLIHEKSDGNPFFLEEVIRTLIDSGALVRSNGTGWQAAGDVQGIAIPDSLQSLLMARMDRLEEETRRVLQLASVIGRNFYYRVLAQITDSASQLDRYIQELQQGELIREGSRVPELEYIFRHAMTQETAYKSILRQRRRIFHLKVGQALEELFPERSDELAPVLAHHFAEGGDDPKSLQYHQAAGEAAERLYAIPEAAAHYGRAIRAALRTEAEPEALIHLYERRGRTLELQAKIQQALEAYEALRSLGVERGDDRMELAALVAKGTIYSTPNESFDSVKADQVSERALALAESLGDSKARTKIYWNRINQYRLQGKTKEAIEAGEQGIALANEHNLLEMQAFITQDVAHALSAQDLVAAKENFRKAIELWRKVGNRTMLADGLSSLSMYSGLSGDYETAITACRESLAISRETENLWGQSFSLGSLGVAYLGRGRWEQALKALHESEELANSAGYFIGRAYSSAFIGFIYADLGLPEKAIQFGKNATSDVPAGMEIFSYSTRSLEMRGLIDSGDFEAAEEVLAELPQDISHLFWYATSGNVIPRLYLGKKEFQRALEVARGFDRIFRQFQMIPLTSESMLLQGRALIGLERFDEAAQAFAQSLEMAEGGHSPNLQWQALAQLAALDARLGDHESAGRRWADAREIIIQLADGLSDPALRESFLGQATVRQVLETAGPVSP